MRLTWFSLAFIALLQVAHADRSCRDRRAAASCTTQQYNNIPGFPAAHSGCYPLGYNSASDLGQTTPADAQQRCEQQCTSQGKGCGSVVAQVNKAADSNLYSGTCYYFAPENTPKAPRQCADTAYLLLGFEKDSLIPCFSTSSSAASAFCSSYLYFSQSISTKTSTPSAVVTTVTVTRTTSTLSPVTTTTTLYPTVVSTQRDSTVTTNVVTNTQTATVTITTTQQSTSTVSAVTTTTSIYISSTTTTTVTYYSPPSKRSLIAKRAAAAATPACVTRNTPASRLSAACSCLNLRPSPSTTTVTLTAVTSTVSNTAVQTNTGTTTVLVTTTASTFTSIATQTVTSTAISTSVTTQTQTATNTYTALPTTITTTSTSVSTDVRTSTVTTVKTSTGCPNGFASPSAISAVAFGTTYNYMCCANAKINAGLSNGAGFFGSPDPNANLNNVSEQECADNCAQNEGYLNDCLGFTFTSSGGHCMLMLQRAPIQSSPGSVACYQV